MPTSFPKVLVGLVGAAALLAGACTPALDDNACVANGHRYAAGATFPAGDGCNSCTCTSSGVACTLIACIPAGCAFDTTYSYGYDGGNGFSTDQTTLTPPFFYRATSTAAPFVDGGGTMSCSPAMPECGDPAKLDPSDITADLAQADVTAALASQTHLLFGVDYRPVDGAIFYLQRADGRGFFVGGPCTGSSGCLAIPPGVQKLADDLRALDVQQRMDASCAGIFSTP